MELKPEEIRSQPIKKALNEIIDSNLQSLSNKRAQLDIEYAELAPKLYDINLYDQVFPRLE